MIRRHIRNAVRRALADTPAVLLNGARQTGKTTLAKEIAGESGARYFTLDDAATLALASSDPQGFIQSLQEPVVLDEVQKAPGLFPAIKLSVDRDRRPGRFLLTGSASILTLPRLPESLVGRMEVIPLFPFSAGEQAGSCEGFLTRLFKNSPSAKRKTRAGSKGDDLPSRLARGGYPEAVRRHAGARRAAWFASYISTLLQRDVRDLARLEALHALPNLLKLLAVRSSGLLNLADVARDAALPHTTLTRYLALLEGVFLVHRLPAWSANLGQRLVKAPKIHFDDTGLACHLLGANSRRLVADRQLLGKLLESFVVGELRKQASWDDPGVTLHHFRAANGSEVDVILEKPDGTVAAIEVKASATVSASDLSALRALRDQLGARFHAGVLLYLGDQALPAGEKLWVLPVPALWAP